MAEGTHLFEEAVQDGLNATGDGGVTGAHWTGDEVGHTSENAGIGLGTNLLQTSGQERETTALEDLSASERRSTTGG